MRLELVVVVTLFMSSVNCQRSIDEIDFARIPQKKIRQYLSDQIKNDRNLLSDFHPSCSNKPDFPELNRMENSYLIMESADIVWDTYNSANLTDAWNGKMISFGLLCSKWSEYIVYRNSTDFCGIDTGQVFFINLRIFRGIFNLPVGLQVIEIDNQNMTIAFSYLEGGKSVGTQTIKLTGTSEGYTEITHTSAFKSDSPFRDKRLYPYYHTKVLNEFHRNIARDISSDGNIFYVLSPSGELE